MKIYEKLTMLHVLAVVQDCDCNANFCRLLFFRDERVPEMSTGHESHI